MKEYYLWEWKEEGREIREGLDLIAVEMEDSVLTDEWWPSWDGIAMRPDIIEQAKLLDKDIAIIGRGGEVKTADPKEIMERDDRHLKRGYRCYRVHEDDWS